MLNHHSFHIVDQSPWPLIASLNLLNNITYIILNIKFSTTTIHLNFTMLILINFLLILLSLYLWWRDIRRERTFQGHHTFKVLLGLKIRIILFITREVIFFLRFFWRFFYFSLAPEFEIGNSWPPTFTPIINPYHMPLLNTIILLRSGASVTWAHYCILTKNYKKTFYNIFLTVLLGITFSLLQFIEYNLTEFCINDRSFGSVFFITTGFHGFHVLIGSIFLTVNILNLYFRKFNNYHHFSFEAAAWYWHFVDVVWIYLYTFMYWWFF